MIDHTVKTFLKRVEAAQLALADLLNHSMFGHNGPVKGLRSSLGATAENVSVLAHLLPDKFTGDVFPRKESDAHTRPLSKKGNDALVLAVGLLRRFDAEMNNAVPNELPQCSFANDPPIKGINRLAVYGPLGLEVFYAVCSALGGLFASNVSSVETTAGVNTAMSTKLTV